MSFEAPKNEYTPEIKEPSVEDLNAAEDLIKEHPLLKDHPRVQQLLENNFVLEDGRQLDPGEFLANVLAVEEARATKIAEGELKEDLDSDPLNASEVDMVSRVIDSLVVHSDRPELEQQRDLRPN